MKVFKFVATCLLWWQFIFQSDTSFVRGFQSTSFSALPRCSPSIDPVAVETNGRSHSLQKNLLFTTVKGTNGSSRSRSPFRQILVRLRVFLQRHLYRLLGRQRWLGLQQRFRAITERYTIYVLECQDGKYYVGSTQHKKQRFRQHFVEGTGSTWTRQHKPVRVLKQYKRVPKDYALGLESKVTAETMLEYGVNNVRGAMFCNAHNYTLKDLEPLTGFVGHYNDLNYRAVRKRLREELPGHDCWKKRKSARPNKNYVAKQRTRSDDVCFKCGEKGHWAADCPQKVEFSAFQRLVPRRNGTDTASDLNGNMQQQQILWKVEEFNRRNGNQLKPESSCICFRCGARGHKAVDCSN